jgi:hypothetical protein
VKKALLMLVCLFSVGYSVGEEPEAANMEASVQTGMDISQTYLSKFGNIENIDSLIINPMLGEGSLETTDGSKSFKAPLVCGSDVPFMRLTMGIGGGGDLNVSEVAVDTNYDGTLDQTLRGLAHISGSCSNGYVSCTAGTWRNCRFYQWDVDGAGRLVQHEVSQLDVGSCNCINQSCAPNFSSVHFTDILTQTGAVISQTLAKRDYSLAVTRVNADGPSVTYFGQTISSCGDSPVLGQSYFDRPNDMEAAATATLNADVPSSRIYDLARTSAGATEAAGNITNEQCSINRESSLDEISLLDVVSIGGGTATANLVNANTIDLTVGRIGDNYLNPRGCALFEQSAQLAIFRPDRIESAILEHVVYDDHIQVLLNETLVWNGPYGDWTNVNGLPPTGPCERDTSHDLYDVSVDVLNTFPATPGTLQARLRIWVGGKGEGYARIRVGVNTECRVAEDRIVNSCTGYQEQEQCRLKEEVVDGIKTVTNFARTGIEPLPQTTVLSSPTCEKTITREWMNIQRTYECQRSTTHDLDQAAQRVHTVESTTSGTSYTDLRSAELDGPQIEIGGDMTIFDGVSVDRCTLQCKVKIPGYANEVTVFGLTGDNLKENSRDETEYRPCAENACPISAGEELVQDCGCINGFTDAAMMLQMIRLAGSDMICTSGNKQQPTP